MVAASPSSHDELTRHFLWSADNLFAGPRRPGRSPLYERLARDMAGDPDLLALAAVVVRPQPVSMLFFGAVHYLLLYRAPTHPLADFFPSLRDDPRPPDEAYPVFRRFCLDYREDIQQLLMTRRVQTNEVQRCACLVPAFELIARDVGREPLALIELGSSAGLNLLWDRYGYDYGEAGRAGDETSPVQISTTLQGARRPPLPEALPAVRYRLGVDLNPVDVCDDEAVHWLRALVWPEHGDRARLLERACALARQAPPPIIGGDMVDVLPRVLEQAPPDAPLCVVHSFTLNQLPHEQRDRVSALLVDAAATRRLFRLSLEWYSDRQYPELLLYRCHDGPAQPQMLATCDAHGRWMEWMADEP